MCDALVELFGIFQKLCAKTLYVTDLERLEEGIVIILCKLEMIFPQAFFDIMIHLVVHLPHEAKLVGPVSYQWMYPFERYFTYIQIYQKIRKFVSCYHMTKIYLFLYYSCLFRNLGTLKKYVRHKARPEGSIAEAYTVNEALTFCSIYLRGIETRFSRVERNDDNREKQARANLPIFSQQARPIDGRQLVQLSKEELVCHK